MKSAAAVQIKLYDNRKERAIQRETTIRKRIQAEVDRLKISEKYKTKRVGTFHEVSNRWIDESNEIINAIDTSTVDAHINLKKGGRLRLKLSPVSMSYLMGYVLPAIQDFNKFPSYASKNQLLFDNMQRGAKDLQRIGQQGDVNYTNNYNPETEDQTIPPEIPDPPDPEPNTPDLPDTIYDVDETQVTTPPYTPPPPPMPLQPQIPGGADAYQLYADIQGMYWNISPPYRKAGGVTAARLKKLSAQVRTGTASNEELVRVWGNMKAQEEKFFRDKKKRSMS